MRYGHLTRLVPIALLTTSVAVAAPRSSLRPLVAGELPARCRTLAVEPASATIVDPDFAAHLSVANCVAEESMSTLTLRPDAASSAALDAAAGASVAMFDDVIAHGDHGWQKAAQSAKADLLIGMVVRMRSVTNDPSAVGLELNLAPWLKGAREATQEAMPLAHR